LSYLVTAFLPAPAPPSAEEARSYLLEGALFDTRPEIAINGDEMVLRYAAELAPMVLRRLSGEDAEAARGEAVELATMGERADIAAAISSAATVLEWDVERTELDEDAWFALHLWQAWVLRPFGGWLLAPGDGLFDAKLVRIVPDLH
jgi:hypothetical protein